jgi:hypothetical protein
MLTSGLHELAAISETDTERLAKDVHVLLGAAALGVYHAHDDFLPGSMGYEAAVSRMRGYEADHSAWLYRP